MRSTLYFSRTGDRREFVKRVLDKFSDRIQTARNFLIKPNLVSADPYPTTTHPEVLDSVLDYLSGKSVVVGDGPAADAGSSKNIVKNSPLQDICRRHHVALVDLHETASQWVRVPRGLWWFRIYSLPVKTDFVISLPVLKAHSHCHITGALKNQFGYLPRRERFFIHGFDTLGFSVLGRGIAAVNLIAKPDLFIMDAVKTLIGCQEKRHGGRERDLGYMLASSDPVALDTYGLSLMKGVDPRLEETRFKDVYHLKYSMEYGVGSADFSLENVSSP